MLRIRFSRTGKVGQPSYRIVVAEHRMPVKGRYLELLGNYMPARKPKIVFINKERVLHWISKGAKPSDSIAALLKKEGFANMDMYLEPRTKKRAMKSEEKVETKPATAAGAKLAATPPEKAPEAKPEETKPA